MQAFPHASLYQVGPIHKGSGYWFQGRMPGKSSLYDIRCFTHVQSLSPEQRLVVALELQQRYQQLEREAAERQERREAMWLEGLSPEQRLEARQETAEREARERREEREAGERREEREAGERREEREAGERREEREAGERRETAEREAGERRETAEREAGERRETRQERSQLYHGMSPDQRLEAMWLEGLSPEQRLEARRPAGAFCVIVSVTRMHALLHVLACAWDVSALLASVCLQLAHV